MITFDDNEEERTKMPCGHPISTTSMVNYLKSIINDKKYEITCPLCKQVWPFKICKEVGVLMRNEMKDIE
jgi:uncharacterized protein YbaR (Trm112 family)